jgi:hypothetical protein
MTSLQNLKQFSFSGSKIENWTETFKLLSGIKKLSWLLVSPIKLNNLPPGFEALKQVEFLFLLGSNFDEAEQRRIKSKLPGCYVSFDGTLAVSKR